MSILPTEIYSIVDFTPRKTLRKLKIGHRTYIVTFDEDVALMEYRRVCEAWRELLKGRNVTVGEMEDYNIDICLCLHTIPDDDVESTEIIDRWPYGNI